MATEYDPAGRLSGVRQQGSSSYYVGAAPTDTGNRVQYTAQGAMAAMKLGNGLWEHTAFNSRLQPVQIGLGSSSANSSVLQLDYAYGMTTNNGNVQSQSITVPTIGTAAGFTLTQNYSYDQLNRLLSAEEMNGATQAWKQSYQYDRFGNRRIDTGTDQPTNLKRTSDNIKPADFDNPSINEANDLRR